MVTAKIAISIDKGLIDKIDEMVEKKVFPSRSKAIQQAVSEKIHRLDKTRLEEACQSLDPKLEEEIAEEGMSTELDEWPEY